MKKLKITKTFDAKKKKTINDLLNKKFDGLDKIAGGSVRCAINRYQQKQIC